jgi:hypothetical protein
MRAYDSEGQEVSHCPESTTHKTRKAAMSRTETKDLTLTVVSVEAQRKFQTSTFLNGNHLIGNQIICEHAETRDTPVSGEWRTTT